MGSRRRNVKLKIYKRHELKLKFPFETLFINLSFTYNFYIKKENEEQKVPHFFVKFT